jgi:hypothetical protein
MTQRRLSRNLATRRTLLVLSTSYISSNHACGPWLSSAGAVAPIEQFVQERQGLGFEIQPPRAHEFQMRRVYYPSQRKDHYSCTMYALMNMVFKASGEAFFTHCR